MIAEEFAAFFSKVGLNYSNKIQRPHKCINEYLNKINASEKSIFLAPTSEDEISRLLASLKSKNSDGHDGISNKIIKEIQPALCKPLRMLFNHSLRNGIFPDYYKKADMVPLHKSKCKQTKTNYRPVSLLPVLSKILEKIVYSCIYSFMTSSNQLFVSQYGFRLDHSCENAISELYAHILKQKSCKRHMLALFLDLSKAFDTLDHKILLTKL